jgi:hypothetical protein
MPCGLDRGHPGGRIGLSGLLRYLPGGEGLPLSSIGRAGAEPMSQRSAKPDSLKRICGGPLVADTPVIGVPVRGFGERIRVLALPLLDTAQDALGVSAQMSTVDVAVSPQICQFGLHSPLLDVGL